MRYVEEFNVYIDEDLVIYGNWSSNRKRNPENKLFQIHITTNKLGYKYFRCRLQNGKWTVALVHRIVALAFIPNPDNKPTVDHINRNPSDNRISNLRWATRIEQALNREIVVNCRYGHVKDGRAQYMRNYRASHKSNPAKNLQ